MSARTGSLPHDLAGSLSPEQYKKWMEERDVLTKIAAECHRAKWQFDLSEDYRPSRAAARVLIAKAFDELHRIGDIALKLRDRETKP